MVSSFLSMIYRHNVRGTSSRQNLVNSKNKGLLCKAVLCIVIAWLAQLLFGAYQSLALTLCKSTFCGSCLPHIKISSYGKNSDFVFPLP